MEKENIYSKSIKDLKEYADLHKDLLKLAFLEKSSRIISLVALIFVLLLLIVVTIFFLSLALMYKLETLWNSQILAALGIAGLYILLILCVYLFKNVLFENPLIRQLSKIIFDEAEEKGSVEDKENNETDKCTENEPV